ncbi:hypothetical protein VB735_16755 [Halotia wernerae UHCC 0503]|nr:hypothetical protein [Halotia wernerae UHCC 0503]
MPNADSKRHYKISEFNKIPQALAAVAQILMKLESMNSVGFIKTGFRAITVATAKDLPSYCNDA